MAKRYGTMSPGTLRAKRSAGGKEPGARTINGSQNPNGLSGRSKRPGAYGQSWETRGAIPPVIKKPRLTFPLGTVTPDAISGDESPLRRPARTPGRGWWERGPGRRA